MAYSSVRVQFEIGHEASVRTKKTPEGFTHDWEVFVRGADHTDIQCFVEKVVFHLHETFPKPKRVIKEPPYVVKESGYAGFVLPIDVYLKNKEEPKKISFQYDLQLQNSGPPISRVLREPRVFQNPSEDFRRKLIRGGGVGVDTPSDVPADDSKSSSAVTKSKITESPIKKYKPGSSPNNTFSELFGTPIRRVNPEKKVAEVVKQPKVLDVKDEKKKLNKHSPHKDEKEKEKEKYDKDRGKEREKGKEKVQKRPQSPVVVKVKEEHKEKEKERKKEDHDEKKKRREEKDKKYKEIEKKEEVKKEKKDSKEEFSLKKVNSSKPDIKLEKHNNEEKDKERPEKEKHKHRHKKKEKEKNRDKEKHKKDKEKSEKDYKEKDKDREKSKKKHEDVKEKPEKRKKSRSPSPVPEKPKKGPLNALLDELVSSDSASALSDDEDSIPSFKSLPKTTAKIVPEIKSQPVINSTPKFKSTNENKEPEKRPEEILIKTKKDKSPGKKDKKSEKKHKNRSSSEREKEEEELEKIKKEREERERLEKEQAEKERFERERLEAEKAKSLKKDKDSARKRKREKLDEPPAKSNKKESENNIGASQSESIETSDEINKKADKFTKEYVAQLRDLQHRIMTIEDNAELQKVVQVIAETGQYEITKKTFDFDLCALDCDTVRRLQEFFTT